MSCHQTLSQIDETLNQVERDLSESSPSGSDDTLSDELSQEDDVSQEINEELEEANRQFQIFRQKMQDAAAKKEKLVIIKKAVENRKKFHQKEKKHELSARTKNGRISQETRDRIEDAISKKGLSWKECAELFKVSRSSVASIVRTKREREKAIENDEEPKKKIPRKRGPTSPFSQKKVIVYALEVLEKDPSLTLHNIVDKLQSDLDVTTSVAALSRFYKETKVTWKVGIKIPKIWNSPQKRKEFVEELVIQLLGSTTPIYIDESGFHLTNLTKSRGRAVAGFKVELSVQPKSKRLNVIAALSPTEIILTTNIISTLNRNGVGKGGVNARDFRNFLRDLGDRLKEKNIENPVLILDNAKIHHAKLLDEGTWQLMKDYYKASIIFLPPYSPFLNPIEYVFNTVKNNIQGKEYTGNYNDFIQLMEQEFINVKEDQIINYFSHCSRYHKACSDLLPFTGNILYPTVDSS